MVSFYNIGIGFYNVALFIVSFFNLKAKKLVDGQKNAVKLFTTKTIPENCIWFHCASVGEYEQGLPLINQLKTQFPSYRFLITFYSPSGYEFAKNKNSDNLISYLPVDTQKSMREFIEKINPAMVFIVKYEFWYHLLNELQKKQIPTFLVSGIFRKKQVFFKPIIGSFFQTILSKFTHLFLQDEESKQLLKSISIHNVIVVGDTRIDRVLENKSTPFQDNVLENFIGNSPVFIGGSVWNSDTIILKSCVNNLPKNWKFIFVPHEINSFSTNWIEEPFQKYSTLKNDLDRILIIDKMGLLSKIYRYAALNYVGGGFESGLHNILEPAVFGKPILIGPKFEKFIEAKKLVADKIAFSVKNNTETNEVINNLLANSYLFNEIENKLSNYFIENTNVSKKIIVYLSEKGYLNKQK